MPKLTEKDIQEIYHDIAYVVESEHVNDVAGMLSDGARLLNINKNPAEYKYAFVYCVGWPSSSGDVPDWILRYGGA